MGAAKEALQVSALPQVYVWSQLGDGGYMGAYCLPLLGGGEVNIQNIFTLHSTV